MTTISQHLATSVTEYCPEIFEPLQEILEQAFLGLNILANVVIGIEERNTKNEKGETFVVEIFVDGLTDHQESLISQYIGEKFPQLLPVRFMFHNTKKGTTNTVILAVHTLLVNLLTATQISRLTVLDLLPKRKS